MTLSGNITDLSPLSNLETILGNLTFDGCDVTDFSPISGLQESGSLFFYDNPNLTNLNGLPTSIATTAIQVIGNPNLLNLDGFPTVTNFLDNITIANNASLNNIEALSSVSGAQLAMVLVIDLNPKLESLVGLENITDFMLREIGL